MVIFLVNYINCIFYFILAKKEIRLDDVFLLTLKPSNEKKKKKGKKEKEKMREGKGEKKRTTINKKKRLIFGLLLHYYCDYNVYI